LTGNNRVVDWQGLQSQLAPKLSGLGFSQTVASSAMIAFQMIEEVERVKIAME